MSKPVAHVAITANRLRDGVVVYRTAAPSWSPRFEEAELLVGDAPRDAALAWGKECQAEVCGVYALDVLVQPTGERTMSQRERLRAAGPDRVLDRLRLNPNELATRTENRR